MGATRALPPNQGKAAGAPSTWEGLVVSTETEDYSLSGRTRGLLPKANREVFGIIREARLTSCLPGGKLRGVIAVYATDLRFAVFACCAWLPLIALEISEWLLFNSRRLHCKPQQLLGFSTLCGKGNR